jgi:predicted dehydrogenase
MKRVLIVGGGGIAQRQIRGFHATGEARLSVVEPIAERRAALRERQEIEAAFTSLDDADPPGFDLAVICTPAHLHVPIAVRCAESGLPFLLEKPLAVSREGVNALLEKVAARQVPARVAYTRRSAPEVVALRDEIRTGAIGDVRMCLANLSQDFPKYRPDFSTTYYARLATGGGALLDAASHVIDLLIWMLGIPVEVAAMYDRLILEGVEGEDACLLLLRFASGAMAQVAVNQFQKPNTAAIEMIGTRGNLLLEHMTLRHAADDSGAWASRDFAEGRSPTEMSARRFRAQAEAMLGLLDGRPDHLTTLEEAALNLDVVLAAKESYRDRRIVTLAPPR